MLKRQYQTMVVAGVLERDGQLLICQRRTGQRHPLKWEFPGGKIEQGETPRQALKRELAEELAVDATPGAEIARYEHRYRGHRPLLLIFFKVGDFSREPTNLEFKQIRWVAPQDLPKYDFLEGDKDFIRRLANNEY